MNFLALCPKPHSFFWLLGFLIILSSSCISNKRVVYFPDRNFNASTLTAVKNKPEVYRLQPRDVLSVQVKALDTESASFFNFNSREGAFNINQASMYLSGYSVDEDGLIELPQIGAIKVGGLTVNETQREIQEKVAVYLNNATILVKLVSFKITVLGEVKNPGYFSIYNDQATLLEGLGMAGDLTDFGNRENITLIRQTKDGSGAVLIDLKDPKFLSSQYYYLQPNDVIYVQPLKAKNARANLSSLTAVSLLFSAASTAILVLNYLK